MRYAILAGTLALAMSTGACEAADEKVNNSSEPAVVSQKSDSDRGLKHIDLGEEPVTRVGVMSQGQNYGDNTGFPSVVKSDADMDLSK